jgi:hypothetical protein
LISDLIWSAHLARLTRRVFHFSLIKANLESAFYFQVLRARKTPIAMSSVKRSSSIMEDFVHNLPNKSIKLFGGE